MSLVAQIIQINPVAAQTLTPTLNNQACQINIYGKELWVAYAPTGSIIIDPPVYAPIAPVFIDLYLSDVLIIGGCLARNNVGIVQNTYFGFNGEITIVDTQPPALFPDGQDPQIPGLGSRFQLVYWSEV